MQSLGKFRVLMLIAALVLPGLVGCTVVVRSPGPPVHAHYHDYYDEYYYYPSAQVYYHIYTGYYYYYSGHRWIRARVLPRHIHLHSGDRYKFKSRERYPYKRHYYYKKKYKPRSGLRFEKRYDRSERDILRKRYEEYRKRNGNRSGDREGRYREVPGDRDEKRFRHRDDDNRSHRDRDYRRDGRSGKDGYKEKDRDGKAKGRYKKDDDDNEKNGKRFRHDD